MLTVIQYVLFFLLFIVLQISAQHGFKPSITCYTKYEHEERKSQTSNTLLGYSYHQAEITQYATPEGELCSHVGCACFSYRSICSSSSPGSNHYSPCTDEDRLNGIMKWHRGWASHTQCEQMRQHPHTYRDLTCCYTDRCNDQPGKLTKVIDTQLPIQRYDTYTYQTPQSLFISHKSSPRHDSPVYHSTTLRSPDAYKPNPAYDKSLPPNNSLASRPFSNWMIFLALLFCVLIIV